MMKKMFTFMMVLMLVLSSSVCLADGAETSKTISFSGYTFGDTFANIRKDMRLSTVEFQCGQRNARMIGDALADMAERDLPDSNTTSTCFFSRPSGMGKVAGYEADIKLWFVYPVTDDVMINNEADAIFYAGGYEFPSWNDVVPIHTDLQGKLETLYGSMKFQNVEIKCKLSVFNRTAGGIYGWEFNTQNVHEGETLSDDNYKYVTIVLPYDGNWSGTEKLTLKQYSDGYKFMFDIDELDSCQLEIISVSGTAVKE